MYSCFVGDQWRAGLWSRNSSDLPTVLSCMQDCYPEKQFLSHIPYRMTVGNIKRIVCGSQKVFTGCEITLLRSKKIKKWKSIGKWKSIVKK
jgi:hypothetical protein